MPVATRDLPTPIDVSAVRVLIRAIFRAYESRLYRATRGTLLAFSSAWLAHVSTTRELTRRRAKSVATLVVSRRRRCCVAQWRSWRIFAIVLCACRIRESVPNPFVRIPDIFLPPCIRERTSCVRCVVSKSSGDLGCCRSRAARCLLKNTDFIVTSVLVAWLRLVPVDVPARIATVSSFSRASVCMCVPARAGSFLTLSCLAIA